MTLWLAVAVALSALGAFGAYYRRTVALERTIRRQMAREASLKARFDDIFERASDIIIVHDRRGRVATINRTGERASGYPREEARMLDPGWLFSPIYIDGVESSRVEPMRSAPATAPEGVDARVGEPAAQQGSGVVLLAEDDRAVRRLVTDELRRRGFTVLEARHGGEALEVCTQYGGEIDLLVTDVVMPTLNGVDLVAAATPLRPEMAVLFISGHPERAGSGINPLGPHAGNLLLKPFTTDVLVARVHDALEARRIQPRT